MTTTDINIEALDIDAAVDDAVWINGEEYRIQHTHQEGNTCHIHLKDPIVLSDGDGNALMALYVVDLSIQ